jgi:release factor glutamine methyltransferase
VEFPKAHVVATDISAAALAVARRNAERHQVAGRITFVECSFLEGVSGTADLIVSNPPYLAETDVPSLQPEVSLYEPRQALAAGPDGLSAIRALLASAAPRLAAGGRLVVEFGFGQDVQVAALAAAHGWEVRDIRRDLQQIPRTIVLGR